MYFIGLTSRTPILRPSRLEQGGTVAHRPWPVRPHRSASRSTTRKPTLWRVCRKRSPGLPSPQITFMARPMVVGRRYPHLP